jgi:hypothetical protein
MVYLDGNNIKSIWASDPSHKMAAFRLSLAKNGTAADEAQAIRVGMPQGEYAGQSVEVPL